MEEKKFIVKNNKSEYIIVIPDNCGEFIKDGAKDFSELFEKATGARLEIKTDRELGIWTENSKILSFGYTTCLAQVGVAFVTLNLGASGFVNTSDASIKVLTRSVRFLYPFNYGANLAHVITCATSEV